MKLLTYPIIAFAAMFAPACPGELASAPKLELAPTPRAARLYPDFPTDGIFPRIEDAQSTPDPSALRQPESLAKNLKAIQTGTLEERLEALKKKSIDDQVFVGGGKFLMGDFGHLQIKEGLPWSSTKSNKPLREVMLSSYSISKYKVTYAEFDLYTEANGLENIQTEEWFQNYRLSAAPAGVTWEQAKSYCSWLGKLTEKPFDLPTEAQWEFAARSRGFLIVWPTDDGTLTWDRNVPSYKLFTALNEGSLHPIALFPPNPLGIYDLAHNGMEWTNDWYSDSDYADSPAIADPRGPSTGKEKVVRSWPPGWDLAAMSFDRHSEPMEVPEPRVVNGLSYGGGPSTSNTVRCATAGIR